MYTRLKKMDITEFKGTLKELENKVKKLRKEFGDSAKIEFVLIKEDTGIGEIEEHCANIYITKEGDV